MSKEKAATAEKVKQMYKQGYSSKDICLACGISTLTVRTILRKAGFDTRNYRKVSISNKEKVLLLIKAGYSYKQIEGLLHVSTHLIREIVTQADLIGFAPKYHHPIELNISEKDVSFKKIETFKVLYLSGEYGLSKCAEQLGISDEEFLWFVFHLTKNDIETHTKNLREHAIMLYKSQLPASAVAKKLDVSLAIIKKIIH